jgi:hypothetical protein
VGTIAGETQKGNTKERDVRMSNIIAAKGENTISISLFWRITDVSDCQSQLSLILCAHPWVLVVWIFTTSGPGKNNRFAVSDYSIVILRFGVCTDCLRVSSLLWAVST